MGQQYRSRSLILIAKGNCTPGLGSDHLHRQAQRKTTKESFSSLRAGSSESYDRWVGGKVVETAVDEACGLTLPLVAVVLMEPVRWRTRVLLL